MNPFDVANKIESCFISVNRCFKALQKEKRIKFKKLHPDRKVDIRISAEEQNEIIKQQCELFELNLECFMKIFKGDIK